MSPPLRRAQVDIDLHARHGGPAFGPLVLERLLQHVHGLGFGEQVHPMRLQVCRARRFRVKRDSSRTQGNRLVHGRVEFLPQPIETFERGQIMPVQLAAKARRERRQIFVGRAWGRLLAWVLAAHADSVPPWPRCTPPSV